MLGPCPTPSIRLAKADESVATKADADDPDPEDGEPEVPLALGIGREAGLPKGEALHRRLRQPEPLMGTEAPRPDVPRESV